MGTIIDVSLLLVRHDSLWELTSHIASNPQVALVHQVSIYTGTVKSACIPLNTTHNTSIFHVDNCMMR